jgi:hypothetical protein
MLDLDCRSMHAVSRAHFDMDTREVAVSVIERREQKKGS